MSENDELYAEDYIPDCDNMSCDNADAALVYNPYSCPQSSRADLKLAIPTSVEIQVRQFRSSMEPWKEVLLIANDLLLWKKQWHASALIIGSTLLFLFIWYSDPRVLTIISSIGLLGTIADFLLPILLSLIFKENNWSTEKQKQYEEICTSIILYKTKAELVFSSFNRMRITNPKLYFFITVVLLSFLTWFGGSIDNCILSYFIVTFLLLFPGMQHHGMLKKTTEAYTKLFNSLIENAKTKIAKKKIH